MTRKSLLNVFLTVVSVFSLATASAQVTIAETDTSYCVPQPLTFHANVDSGQTAAGLVIADDTYSELIDLDFPFVFYGDTFLQCVLSTNAYITFNLSEASTPGSSVYSPWPIDDTDPFPTPNQGLTNVIMGPWHDTYPGVGSGLIDAMNYKTVGVAPNRVFVFSFCEVPMFSCTSLYFSGQILLYEGSNNIEVHLAHKIVCPGWNTGQAVLGVMDQSGTLATIVPGYNVGTQWTATNEAWRFTPNGPTNYAWDTIPYNPIPIYGGGAIAWYDNGSLIGNGDSVPTNLAIGEHEIIAEIQGCYGIGGRDTIHVTIGATGATYSQLNVQCPEASNGNAIVDFTNNNVYSTVWNNASGMQLWANSGNLDADTLQNLAPGVYTLHIFDTLGCETIHDFTIVAGTYVADLDYAPADICMGAFTDFTNTSNETFTSATWTFSDDGSTASGNTTQHTFDSAGAYSVTLAITNAADGCYDDTSVSVLVNPNITGDFSHMGTYCAGEPVSFTDLSSPYPNEWLWVFGDGGTSDVRNPEHVFNSSGTYTITMNVLDSLCGAATITKTVTINYFPNVDLNPDSTIICKGQSVTFDAGNSGDTYSWNLGGSQQIQSFTFQSTTPVSVSVNHFGCVSGDTVLVIVDCFLEMPTAFTPNGDGINSLFRPYGKNISRYELYVYDRWGKQVYSIINGNLSASNEGWDGKINGADAEIGVYPYFVKGILMDDTAIEQSGNVTLLR